MHLNSWIMLNKNPGYIYTANQFIMSTSYIHALNKMEELWFDWHLALYKPVSVGGDAIDQQDSIDWSHGAPRNKQGFFQCNFKPSGWTEPMQPTKVTGKGNYLKWKACGINIFNRVSSFPQLRQILCRCSYLTVLDSTVFPLDFT